MASQSLWYQYKTANVAIKLIVINVFVFLFFGLTSWALGVIQESSIMTWFVLPSDLSTLLLQPWGIITYAFLHGGFFHILFNMLFLYVFSRYIFNLFTEKRFLTIYLLGAIAGGVFFLLAYNLFPVFAGSKGYLIGASAAVNAIIVFAATYTPNSPIKFFFINLKLWHIAAFVILRDLFTLSSTADNAGGLIAHLGGALFGYVYARQLLNGKDIGLWFENILDGISNSFKKSDRTLSRKRTQKKSPLRTVYKKTEKTTVSRPSKSEQQQKIDAILDKISKSGYDSLSKAEKDFLFKAGKD